MTKKMSALSVVALAAACLGACNEQAQLKESTETKTAIEKTHRDFKTLEDRFSYAYGADLAQKFKMEGVDLNVALMAEAMQSVFDGSERRMTAQEVAATMDMYREVHLKEKEEERAVAAVKNKKEGEAFLKENAKKEGVIVTKSGLQYKVITPGKGRRKPTTSDEVKVQYRARHIDGKEFDSTYSRNAPYSVNAKMLIDGWAEALQLMTEGSKWELYVPAELAYGEKGSEPHIGPNAVLIFEVELLEIDKH